MLHWFVLNMWKKLKQELHVLIDDPPKVRRRKFTCVILFILLIVDAISFLMAVFSMLVENTFFRVHEANTFILSTGISSIVLLCLFIINQYHPSKVVGIILVAVISFLIFLTDSPHNLYAGRGLLTMILPIILCSIMLRPILSFITSVVLTVMLTIIALLNNDIPSFIPIFILLLSGAILWYSSTMMERFIQYSQRNEQVARFEMKRNALFQDIFSHDINNILQNINGLTEIFDFVKKTGKNEDIKRIFHKIHEQVILGSQLVRNVKIISKFDQRPAGFKKMDIRELLSEVLKEIQKTFCAHNLLFQENFPSTECMINAPWGMKDAFKNILINSIVHNESNIIKVWIQVIREKEEEESEKGKITVEIVDNGIGIPDAIKADVLERTRNGEVGDRATGLGLFLVARVISMAGGTIRIENRVKQQHEAGTRIIINLPRVEK